MKITDSEREDHMDKGAHPVNALVVAAIAGAIGSIALVPVVGLNWTTAVVGVVPGALLGMLFWMAWLEGRADAEDRAYLVERCEGLAEAEQLVARALVKPNLRKGECQVLGRHVDSMVARQRAETTLAGFARRIGAAAS